jgi:aspartokinase/homoserine dehydrogenase 1
LEDILARLRARHGTPLALVDCTASDELAARHASLLAAGIAVVTANKRSLAAPLKAWRALREAARRAPLRSSTTVGAGLPVLATVRALRRRGDALWTVRAALSGTLSFVLSAVHDGVPLSRAVALARARGLAEPHPAADLSGADVARKLLIVLREAGVLLETGDVRVKPLVPAECLALPDPESFLKDLEAHDSEFAERAEAAAAKDRRLVYVASWDGARAQVGLSEVEASDMLARARPAENIVLLRTALHDEVPLAIAGPGAGVDVTAAGVHGDLLSAARALLTRGRAPRAGDAARTRRVTPAWQPGHGLAWA